jgi:hypothetical protein
MANCHHLFVEYNGEISIPKAKKDKMSDSKEGLRKRIRKYFKENHPEYEPKFYIQGSANRKMNTGIRTKDDICDLDDGIYFFRRPDVTATTIQNWIYDAVQGYTNTDPEHRKKCIRDIFTNDYEIDHPAYYKVNGQNYRLAVKDNGWEDSDPKAFAEWFHSNKDNNGQLVRLVKDGKGWCDNIRNKMPSGMAITILITNAKGKITYDPDRDDITLLDTLKKIKSTLEVRFECVVPAVPGDDLFKDYDKTRKENFMQALQNFINDATDAIDEDNELKASKLWRRHLGNRFPLGEDKSEEQAKQNRIAQLRATSLLIGSGKAYTDKTGNISSASTGVKNQDHRFHYEKSLFRK